MRLIANLILASTLLLLLAPWSVARGEDMTLDQQIQFVRTLTAAERQATVAKAVALSDEEGTAFWPVYRAYRSEVAGLDDQTVALIKDFADNFPSLTDAKANELSAKWLEIEKKRIATKQKYVKKYEKILPGLKVARVLQIENRLDLLVQLRLASNVPLVRP